MVKLKPQAKLRKSQRKDAREMPHMTDEATVGMDAPVPETPPDIREAEEAPGLSSRNSAHHRQRQWLFQATEDRLFFFRNRALLHSLASLKG